MVSRNENDLVEALYDAALGRQSWNDVTGRLVGYMNGLTLMMSVLHSRKATVDIVATQGISLQHLQEYAHFAPHDVWVSRYMEQRHFGRVMIGSHVVDDVMLTRSLIYNEYLRPKVNMRHVVGSVLPMEGGHHAVFGIHRPHDARDFSQGEAKRLERLVPHLQRALEVRLRLQQAEQATRSLYLTLDRLSLGVIMMNATGRLLHVNAAGEAILRGSDGLTRTPEGLRAAHKDDDRRLQALIGELRQAPGETRPAGGHLRVRRPSGKQPYAVMLAPVGVDLAGRGNAPAILMFVSNPGEKIVSDLAVLEELFGFPPAEARLVLALLSGMTVPEFARKTGLTYNTVRTLVARAMARTDSRSQVELVLLVAGSIGGTLTVGRAPPT